MNKYLYIVFALLLLSLYSQSVDAATSISTCGTISSPGEYVLTQDIATSSGAACLLIYTNGVDIDGSDFTVTGEVIANTTSTSSSGYNFSLSNIIVDGGIYSNGYRYTPGVYGTGVYGSGNGGDITITNSIVGHVSAEGGWTGNDAGHYFYDSNAGNGGNIIFENVTASSTSVSGGLVSNNSSTTALYGGHGGSISLTDSYVEEDVFASGGHSGASNQLFAHAGDGGDVYLERSITPLINVSGGDLSTTTASAGTIEIVDSLVDEIMSEDSQGDQDENITVTDNVPEITLNGESVVTIQYNRSYSEEGATSEDAKDGSLSVNISGAVNTGIAGTYTMTYSAIDDGTTINVNGVEIEYVEPQTSLVTRTVVVEERHRHVGGSRSLNSATKTTPTIIVENQIAPSSKTISPNFSRNLSIGFTGEDVRTLQKYLNTHGFPVATSGVGSLDMETTYFGLLTKAALIRFQSSIGLPSTGFFGPMTQGYIKSH